MAQLNHDALPRLNHCRPGGLMRFTSMMLVLALAACQVQTSELPGKEAPDFTLVDANDTDGAPPVSLAGLVASGPVIIIFHRGLHCPICTAHLSQVSEHMADFTRAGAQVVAIGPDTPAEARASLDTVGPLSIPLLSDIGDKTARAFGLESSLHGLQHATFVVDRSRRIYFARKSDEPVGTVPELLGAAKEAARAQ